MVRAPDSDFDELIYVFHRHVWGKGYAAEVGKAMLEYVFGRSSLAHIYATIHPDNLTSQRVAGKLGMHFDKEVTEPNGERVIFYVIGREAF